MECKSEPKNPIGYFDIFIRFEIVKKYEEYQENANGDLAYNKLDDTYYSHSIEGDYIFKPLSQFFERQIENELREQFELSKYLISVCKADNIQNPLKFESLVRDNVVKTISNLYENYKPILEQFPILYSPLEGIKRELIKVYPDLASKLNVKLLDSQLPPLNFQDTMKEVFGDLKSIKHSKNRDTILITNDYDLLSQYLYNFYSNIYIQVFTKISFNGLAPKVLNCYFYLFNNRIPEDMKSKSIESIAKFIGQIVKNYNENDINTATTRLKAKIPISHSAYMTEKLKVLFIDYELFKP